MRTAATFAGYSLSGRLEGIPFGTLTLVVNGEVVAGTLRTPDDTYTIRSVGGGRVEIQQVVRPMPEFGEPIVVPPQSPSQPGDRPAGSAAHQTDDDGNTLIDVLIVYTAAAREESGGQAEVQTMIDLWVAEANQAYAESGVSQRINLVHAGEVQTEEGTTGSLIDRLYAVDGDMDEVLDLRDRIGADLVHLVPSGVPGCQGIATRPSSTDRFSAGAGFGVTRASCLGDAMAHELGHNMGLSHDRYQHAAEGSLPNAYPYGYGYVNQKAFETDREASSHWFTIMAYPAQLIERQIYDFVPLLRFSDPDRTYMGDPLGVAGNVETTRADGPANARRALNDARGLVADYRTPRPNLVVDVSTSASGLDEGQSFTLGAEIRNRGRVASDATTVTFRRSTDANMSVEDETVATASLGEVSGLGTRSVSTELAAPEEAGDYYYGLCVDDAQAAVPCSAVRLTVGPTVAVAESSAKEGEPLAFGVTLSSARATDVVVRWEVSGGTAAAGVDLDAGIGGTLTIPAGETSGTISVATLTDTVAEPDDTVVVALVDASPPSAGGVALAVGGSEATGTIRDDDGQLEIPDASLRRALEVALGKPAGAEISAADLAELRALQGVYVLRIPEGRIADLTGLEFATSLVSVNLNFEYVTDLSPLAHLSKLTTLDLSVNGVADLTPLGHLTKLRSLNLAFNQIQDVSPLSELRHLSHLNLWNNSVSDIRPLAALTLLRDLNLKRNSISDLTPLAGLTELADLRLQENALSDLSPLSGLEGLKLLFASRNPVSDLSPLSDLTGLESLQLDDTLVADLSPISQLTRMRYISLTRNAITDVSALEDFHQCGSMFLDSNDISDLSSLAHLTQMTLLSLRKNRISDVGPLRGLPRLRWLYLDFNEISDVSPLADLSALVQLDLSNNAISDVGPLAGLHNLNSLDLSGNAVSDIEALGSMPGLSVLDVGHNRITSMSTLASDSAFVTLSKVYVHGNPVSDSAIRAQLPVFQAKGVVVFHVVVSVADASAREGEDIEFTARLSAGVDQPVELNYGGLVSGTDNWGAQFVALDVIPTATNADLSIYGFLGTLTFPAGTTTVETHAGTMAQDNVDEAHEAFVIHLYSRGLLPSGVTLNRNNSGFAGSPYVSQAVGLIVDAKGPSRDVSIFAGADDERRQGFVRVVNRGGRTAAHIEAFDDGGQRRGTVTLSLHKRETVHFNSDDLAGGNLDKGLIGGIGRTASDSRLRLWSNDVDVLSYARSPDGFLTSLHDRAARGPDDRYHLPIFNPGSNTDQVSLLRVVNPGSELASLTIAATDDAGMSPGSAATLRLAAGESRTLTAADLESGVGVYGFLGDGVGKWRLAVASDRPVVVASLLQSPTGHLTNLSTVPDNKRVGEQGETIHDVLLFPSAADAKGRQGFVRVINRGTEDATLRVKPHDDTEREYNAVTLTVGGGRVVHFNSSDLELGNAVKGLSGGVGAGEGHWRLKLTGPDQIDVLSYIRMRDGFLTSVHDVARRTNGYFAVPIFNPGSNMDQVSVLRLVNLGDTDAEVGIEGIDDHGVRRGEVRLALGAGEARMLTAQEMEAGGDAFEGTLGDGSGKWRLIVTAEGLVQVMSLMESPTGHITNLSTALQ